VTKSPAPIVGSTFPDTSSAASLAPFNFLSSFF
jgi:hypothetical protein